MLPFNSIDTATELNWMESLMSIEVENIANYISKWLY